MALGFGKVRVRLRVGIAVMFLSVMLPLTGLMTGILYRQNSQLAVQLAESAMEGASSDVVAGVRSLLGPMARVVELSADFGKEERGSLRRIEGLRPLVEELEKFTDLNALYFGFARDGAFYEAIRVPPPGSGLGLVGRHPPEKARYALRIIDDIDGERVDSWIYITKWGQVVGVERAPDVRYDPRTRPWYATALASKEVATSSLYVFNSIGRPGLTLSRQMSTDDGAVIAVFGADISTETLSNFLAERKVSANSVVFILDEEQRLIGHPDAERTLVQKDGKLEITKAVDFSDPVLADAVRRRNAGAGDRFSAVLGPKGERYLVSFTQFPDDFGKKWTIGVIAAERDFTGPLRHASVLILAIGSLFLVLASMAVVAVSRLLTRPIQTLTTETGRIRSLDLDGEITVRSAVVEIQTLAEALAAMKAALRSFAAYVPKSVVKGIIESGVGTEVGGERRQVTILFSDITGFTRISENVPPEAVLGQLSSYFEGLSRAVASHHGTVDKFIGDSVMAIWNAPLIDADHMANACRAMLACCAATHAFNEDLAARNLPILPTRFGLHTGTVVIGNVGCADRMQYTALGSPVNLASRVENMNKRFFTEMLVTGPVEEVVRGQFLFRPLGLVVATGTTAPVQLFELLGEVGQEAPAKLAPWLEAFAPFQKGDWDQAVVTLQAFLEAFPGDQPARLLRDRALANAAAPDKAEAALYFRDK